MEPCIILNKKEVTDHVLLFLHIPKTAGGTLHPIMEEQYKDYCDIYINGGLSGDFIPWSTDLPLSQKKKIEVLRGHFSFGVHQHLPQKNYTYITLLRNPLERVISLFYYIRRAPGHRHHDLCNQMTLHEFIARKEFTQQIVDNQVYRLSQKKGLDIAKNNLKKYFSVVGITERFDETLYVIKNELGWKINNYEKRNITPNRPSLNEIPKEIVEIIKQKNEKDIQLYQFANKLLDNKLRQLKN